MSRVGKMPVAIPAGVDVSVKEDQISVKGSGGTLSLAQSALVGVPDSGSVANAAAISSRDRPTFCAARRKANRRRTLRGKRRWPPPERADWSSPARS